MDPELLLVGPAVALLAVLGARRRTASRNGPTPGQRLENSGGDVARHVAGFLGTVARMPAEASAAVVRTTGVIGSGILGTTIGAVGRVSGDAVAAVVGGAGHITARGTGLLVDGGSLVVDAAGAIPGRVRGRTPPAATASSGPSSSATGRSSGRSSSSSARAGNHSG